MDIEALNKLQERLDQGSTRLLRERFPWIPFISWKGRDNACVVVPQAGEMVELQLINDAPKAMFIVHTCLMASKAEVDFLRRAVLLYSAAAAPSLPARGLLLALSVGLCFWFTM